jgi:hypothetical protein
MVLIRLPSAWTRRRHVRVPPGSLDVLNGAQWLVVQMACLARIEERLLAGASGFRRPETAV